MTDRRDPIVLNDAHSALNPTRVARVVRPSAVEDVAAAVRDAATEGRGVSISGSRHAMGGQQFGTDTVHVDMRGMTRIVELDDEAGIVHAEAGIEWAELMDGLLAMQPVIGLIHAVAEYEATFGQLIRDRRDRVDHPLVPGWKEAEEGDE